jgi:hypothetical protein
MTTAATGGATAPSPDFTGLTQAQMYLLSYGGWSPNDKRPQPRRTTVRKLIERGLVVERDVVFLGVRMRVYDVPTEIHMAFLEWCAGSATRLAERRA